DSEPMAAVPGAANDLFGSVPAGGSLGSNDDDLGPPEELAAPEEVLRPVAIDDDDPDLPQATGEPAKTRAQPLAAWRPTAVNAMAVDGEHRVAVHTRGGRTLRGTMRDVDLSKSQFPLVPQGGGEPEAVYRAEVKAIFFMLAPGEPAHAGDGGKVRVTFADGRVIEGIRDGAEAEKLGQVSKPASHQHEEQRDPRRDRQHPARLHRNEVEEDLRGRHQHRERGDQAFQRRPIAEVRVQPDGTEEETDQSGHQR